MNDLIDKIEEIKKLEADKGLPYKKSRIFLLKNQVISVMKTEGLKVKELGEFVVRYDPRNVYKRFPDGTISIYSRESWKKSLEYSERKNKK